MLPLEIRAFGWRHSWVLLAFIGALMIHIWESLFRLAVFESFFSLATLLCLTPLVLVKGWAMFWAFRRDWRGEAPSFLTIWAGFIFFIVASRLVITVVYAGEPMNFQIGLGLALLVWGLYLTTLRENLILSIVIGGALLLGGGRRRMVAMGRTVLCERRCRLVDVLH